MTGWGANAHKSAVSTYAPKGIRLHTPTRRTLAQRRWRTNNESALIAARTQPARVLRSQMPTGHTDYQLNSLLCLRGPICLPLSGFTHCFALSSKCFSIFPHGTCSLSDSWSYLAFDGVYHRLHLVLANKATLRRFTLASAAHDTGLAPSMGWSLTQENLREQATPVKTFFTPQFLSPLPATGFGAGLFPFHSQLLWESPLVSFPPLSNMLKFSG